MKKYIIKIVGLLLALIIGLSDLYLATGLTSFNAEESVLINSEMIKDSTSIESSNGIGNLLGQTLEDELNEKSGYAVSSINFVKSGYEVRAQVQVSVLSECELVVAIYEEDKVSFLGSGKTTVQVEDKSVEVIMDLDEFPQYFFVRCFFIEKETLKPLCEAYESALYTRNIQELLSSTVDDYDAERVINFDEDNTTNFAVFDEAVKLLDSEKHNTIISSNDESMEYVLENIDDSVRTLKEDDIISVGEDNNIIIIKVADIIINGDTARIIGKETNVEEVFEVVKLEETANAQDFTVDNTNLDESLSYEGLTYAGNEEELIETLSDDEDEDFSVNFNLFTFEYKIEDSEDEESKKTYGGDVKINGTLKLSVDVKIEYYYKGGDLYVDASLPLMCGFTGKIEGELYWKPELSALSLELKTSTGLTVSITPYFVLEGKVSAAFSATMGGQIGMIAHTLDDIQENNEYIGTDIEGVEEDIKFEGEIFIGVEISTAINVVSRKLLSFSIDFKTGVKLTGEFSPISTMDEHGSEKDVLHACYCCVDGKITWVCADISFSVKILNSNQKTKHGVTLEKLINTFYVSLDTLDVGLGHCPNKYAKVYLAVKDPYGNNVKEAKITGKFYNGYKPIYSVVTDECGRAITYLSLGQNKISVDNNGYKTISREFVVPECLSSMTVNFRKTDILGVGSAIDIVDLDGYRYSASDNDFGYEFNVYFRVNYWPEDKEGYVPTLAVAGYRSDGTVCIDSVSDMDYEVAEIGKTYWLPTLHYDAKNMFYNISLAVGFRYLSTTTGQFEEFIPIQTISVHEGNIPLADSMQDVFYEAYNTATIGVQSVSSVADMKKGNKNASKKIITGLVPGGIYNVYSVKTIAISDVLLPNNILYMNQLIANENGEVQFEYLPKEIVDNPQIFLEEMGKINVCEANVELDNIVYDGELHSIVPVVSIGGIMLREGTDYILTGDIIAKEVGDYSITIVGMGEYTGESTVNYSVDLPIIEVEKVEIEGINVPKAEEALDISAICATVGVTGETLDVIYYVNNEVVEGVAEYDTVYEGRIVLQAEAGYAFSKNTLATVDGSYANVELNSDGTITVSCNFEVDKRKVINVIAPQSPKGDAFEEYYTSENILSSLELGKYAEVILEGKDAPYICEMEVEWSLANDNADEYNAEPGAVNVFKWEIKANEYSGYDTEGIDTTGKISVKNKVAIPVTITGTNATVLLSEDVIDVSKYFSIDENAGYATYSIERTTGKGKMNGTKLLVEEPGVFVIKVNTEAIGLYGAGEGKIELIVEKEINQEVPSTGDKTQFEIWTWYAMIGFFLILGGKKGMFKR